MVKKLSVSNKLGAGVADLGGNVFFAVINFWLMYYLTDMIGISASVAGISIMIGKLWDAITDPLMGYISDHTRCRFGRRKIYMVIGIIPLCLSFIAFFTKVEISQSVLLVIYYTMLYCLINTFYTVIFIPYYSLLAEITDDYHERTSLQSYRMLFALIGNVVGSALAQPIIGRFPNQRTGFTGMAVIFSLVIAAGVLVTVFVTKEDYVADAVVKNQGKAGVKSFFKSYAHVFKNKPYLIIISVMLLCFFALVVSQTTIPYFFKYYLENEGLTTAGILGMALGCIIGIPFVICFSKHFGKKTAWKIGIVVAIIGNLGLFIMASQNIMIIVVCLFISGLGSAGTYVLLMSVVADCVDYDYSRTAVKREGLFIGSTTFVQKLGMALGAAMVGWILQGLGYVADQSQSESVMAGIRSLQTLLPMILNIVSFIILCFYPITEKEYKKIKSEIEKIEKK